VEKWYGKSILRTIFSLCSCGGSLDGRKIMAHTILDDIEFKIDKNRLFQKIHIDPAGEDGERVLALINKAEAIGKPRALYTLSYIDGKENDYVVVDGVKLTSRVMRVNFDKIDRVFPHVATCGRELHEWAEGMDDILDKYWAGTIMEMALETARNQIRRHIEENYHIGKSRSMNPGSLEDWPIGQQKELFRILGDVQNAIGVELTDSCLLIPMKSASGILFQTESDFENCQLCPGKNCPNRRAEYREHLYEEKYSLKKR
jgi:hypothetical protein